MIYYRKATSPEMQKNTQVVKRMTKGMGFDENMGKVNWRAIRVICKFGYKFMPSEKEVKFRRLNLNGVSAVMTIPDAIKSDNIIMYIHGGGLVSGSAKASKGYCSMLAKYSGCRVIAIDYALSPEHKYPDAIDDCFTAYNCILEMFHSPYIALSGESGGAYLCQALAIRLNSNNLQKPACLVVHSTIVAFCDILERDYEIKDFTVKTGCLTALHDIYIGGADVKNPEISNVFYEHFDQFPPVFITCDANEYLRADAHAFYKKCIDAGVEAILIEVENAFHAFASIGTGAPETKQILVDSVEFIHRCFDQLS